MKKTIEKFKGKKIGVIGDLMVDHYMQGDVERISQEAPTPILALREETYVLGGAANVAANIAALGGYPHIIGTRGDDMPGKILLKELKKKGILSDGILRDAAKPTVEKIRVISLQHQMLRIDREDKTSISSMLQKKILEEVSAHITEWDALIISDYAKGMLTPVLIRMIISLSRRHKKPLIADTKPDNFSFFKNVAVITPNKKEAEEIAGKKIVTEKDAGYVGRVLQKKIHSAVLITRGMEGATLFEAKAIRHFSARDVEIADVTGAGDTLLAALALGIAAGASLRDACFIANFAAGLVVEKRHTATVSYDELNAVLHEK